MQFFFFLIPILQLLFCTKADTLAIHVLLAQRLDRYVIIFPTHVLNIAEWFMNQQVNRFSLHLTLTLVCDSWMK
jgi:hypothetical protein